MLCCQKCPWPQFCTSKIMLVTFIRSSKAFFILLHAALQSNTSKHCKKHLLAFARVCKAKEPQRQMHADALPSALLCQVQRVHLIMEGASFLTSFSLKTTPMFRPSRTWLPTVKAEPASTLTCMLMARSDPRKLHCNAAPHNIVPCHCCTLSYSMLQG